MDQWSPGALLGSLAALLMMAAALLFWFLSYLRRTARRYRWFELFVSLFLTFVGFFLLLYYPHEAWPWWLGLFAGWSILSGGYGLGQTILLHFSGRQPGENAGRA